MTSDKTDTSTSRRMFFRAAGFGAGAIGAAAVGLRSGTAKAGETPDETSTHAGYRETEHVKRYYELARF